VRLAHAAGELDNGLLRTVVVVALLEQERVTQCDPVRSEKRKSTCK
jgi:hypothetical protein